MKKGFHARRATVGALWVVSFAVLHTALSATLVLYDGSLLTADSTRAAFDYQDGTNEGRIDFTDSLIYSNPSHPSAQVSGGLRYTEYVGNLADMTFNKAGSYYDGSYAAFVGDSDAGAPGRFQGVLLWNSIGYMAAGDSVSINLTDALMTWDGSALTDGLRFVIKNNGTYYYSQTQFQGSQWTPLATGTYSIADVTTEQWAPWDPAADPSDFSAGKVLPGGGTFSTRIFDDVEAVGLSVDMAKAQYGTTFGFDRFEAEGTPTVPEPATASILILGGALLYRLAFRKKQSCL